MCANLASDGFFYDELSDYRKQLLHETADLFPDKTENFLKDCAKEASKIQKRIARSDVGTSKGKKKKWTAAESYHKRFKVGKIYLYEGARAIRAYNSARHAHLIEDGHFAKNGKFVPGRHVMKSAVNEFRPKFHSELEKFLFNFFSDIGK